MILPPDGNATQGALHLVGVQRDYTAFLLKYLLTKRVLNATMTIPRRDNIANRNLLLDKVLSFSEAFTVGSVP